MNAQLRRAAGFTLLPVILVMTLIAGVAYLLNRDNGMNAAMVASQGDQDRARYAAEAGLQAVSAEIQARDCTGPYPSIVSKEINNNFGGASYQAYANPSSGNTTSLISTGTYNGAEVTLTRNNVIAYHLAPSAYTLQPAGANMSDSYIQASPNANHGNEPTLDLKFAMNSRALLRFDFSALPAGSVPLSATLKLFPLSVSTWFRLNEVYRMLHDWTELGVKWQSYDSTLPWATQGGDYHPVAVASSATPAALNWQSFELTDLTRAWMFGVVPNQGVMVGSPLFEDANVSYASSDAATAANRPKIVFSYLLPCGATDPGIAPPTPTTVTLTSIADATIDVSAAKTTGTDVVLSVGQDAGAKPSQGLVRFDTSSIPPGSTISAAKLRLYLGSTFGNGTYDYGAYRVTSGWTESTASFPTAYDTSAALAALNINHGATGVWYEWPIPSALIQEWVDGVSPNYGLLVNYDSSQKNKKAAFSSREGSNPPQLVISY